MKYACKFAMLSILFCCAYAFSAEETKIPEWIPAMPDVKPEVLNVKKIEQGEEVILFYKTTKSPAEVAAFYEKGFATAGFDKTKFVTEHIAEDGNKQEIMKCAEDKRAWWLSARQDKGKTETTVSIVYQTKS